jgi:hypothetical protein
MMMIQYQMSPRLRHMLKVCCYLIYNQYWFVQSACLCVYVYHFLSGGIEGHEVATFT